MTEIQALRIVVEFARKAAAADRIVLTDNVIAALGIVERKVGQTLDEGSCEFRRQRAHP